MSINKRPQFHYSPIKGWINDPNGLVQVNGQYHLFCQYYPEDTKWGPMHWGHAVSDDLVNWKELDIAISPDELGYIFSGSCILDNDNLSGLGTLNNPALLAFFTSHNPETGEQQQSVYYSLDYVHFQKYVNNPVISNRLTDADYKVDFRDPKIFPNPYLGGYSMVLAAGNVLEFYHSLNLLNWTKTGVFNPSVNGFDGITECPDCFEIEPGTWILTLSTILKDEKVGKPLEEKGYINARVMQYFLGKFNGYTFIDSDCDFRDNNKNLCDNRHTPLIIDYGTDNYAMVTFSNTDTPIAIGWGENWDYVNEMPCDDYKGKMTLARTVSLTDTEFGKRLSFAPVLDENNKDLMSHVQKITVADNATVTFDNLIINVTNNYISLNRDSKNFPIEIDENKYHIMTARRVISDTSKCTFTIIEDAGFYEIFADNGTIVFSVQAY